MTDLKESEIRDLAQRKRVQLEELQSQSGKLEGEAQLEADQQINKLNDEIEELENHPRAEVEHLSPREIGFLGAIKRTWRDLTGQPNSRGKTKRNSDEYTPPPM